MWRAEKQVSQRNRPCAQSASLSHVSTRSELGFAGVATLSPFFLLNFHAPFLQTAHETSQVTNLSKGAVSALTAVCLRPTIVIFILKSISSQ